jgi:hypothetical protein
MDDELLLVGSIPYDTAEDVFRSFGSTLGDHLLAMPDGEVGPRRHWISRVHYQVLAGHPQLESVQHPAPENGVERQFPRNASDSWKFRVREGVDRVRFGDPGWRLGYARDAVNSWFVFRTLREAGTLPKHLRFQVSMPSVVSALPPRIFPDQDDIAKVRPGYLEALAAELRTIVGKCRMPTAPFRASREKAPLHAIRNSSARSRRWCRRMRCSAITCASARWAAGPGSSPKTCPARWRWRTG